MNAVSKSIEKHNLNPNFDWKRIARLVLTSRKIDTIEEEELHPQKKVLYQFSARGHELAQILLGSQLNHQHDAISAYYRSRPVLLAVGLPLVEAFSGPMGKSGGFSNGRDIGVVCNLPGSNSPTVLPMAGDVGSQYTPLVGWAQACVYRRDVLKDAAYKGSIGVVLGGEGSVATNGFWSSLTIATTLSLPILFYIEDNGYAISVTSNFQTPGGNIAENLSSFKNLHILSGDGANPANASDIIADAVSYVRSGKGPALIRLTVPRLCGHSGQDTQAYKPEETLNKELQNDPLVHLEEALVPHYFDSSAWKSLRSEVDQEVELALERALELDEPEISGVYEHRYFEAEKNLIQKMGGLYAEGHKFPQASLTPTPEPTRINMLTAIRRTLDVELGLNQKMVLFGEDIGPKGGVHAATLGLQEKFGADRVFDTSLSEEGIIGRAVGMAICGLLPVAEIQFRKYADPATEQLNNCGTIRWRTANRFAAPIVVRMPGGYFKCGDPWHSMCNEVQFAHAIGWQVAFPSHAEDAVGLLRSALRSNNPTIFFEHRACLDGVWSRRPYPGDSYVIPFGKGAIAHPGTDLTVVSWGAMVERCELAAENSGHSVELIDLRTISPWDRELVLESVKKTRRCLVVHEDTWTAGFGAEICATVASESFLNLDAPVRRLATKDIPIPYNVALMDAVIPSVEQISVAIRELISF